MNTVEKRKRFVVTHSYIIEQGYVLGNPVTDKNIETNYRVPFAHGMGLISDELFEVIFIFINHIIWLLWHLVTIILFSLLITLQSLERSCGGKFFNVDPSNARCSNNLQAYDHVKTLYRTNHLSILSLIAFSQTNFFS